MFENDPRDLTTTAGAMYRAAFDREHANQIAAKEKFKQYLAQDRRFKPFDLDRVADRVVECGQSGARLDWTDPYLRGGEKRPLSR
jgi:hypothetical protein